MFNYYIYIKFLIYSFFAHSYYTKIAFSYIEMNIILLLYLLNYLVTKIILPNHVNCGGNVRLLITSTAKTFSEVYNHKKKLSNFLSRWKVLIISLAFNSWFFFRFSNKIKRELYFLVSLSCNNFDYKFAQTKKTIYIQNFKNFAAKSLKQVKVQKVMRGAAALYTAPPARIQ